jgi:aminoglycoside 6'-N-acetyltransferase I
LNNKETLRHGKSDGRDRWEGTWNLDSLARFFRDLWPALDLEEAYAECERILNKEGEICFLVKTKNRYIGFVFLTIRNDHVEGNKGPQVAYLVGIFVDPGFRRLGIGRILVETALRWSKEKGCHQLASDTELENEPSQAFHKRCGFREVSRIVCYIREVDIQLKHTAYEH